MNTTPSRPIPEFEFSLALVLAKWIALWLILSAEGVPGVIIAAGLFATAAAGIVIRLRPTLVRYRDGDGLVRLYVKLAGVMAVCVLLGSLFTLYLLTALLPASARANDHTNGQIQHVITEDMAEDTAEDMGGAVRDATRNLEKYRAEVEAMIRGAPSFADRQRRLTGPQSLPGNPLAGMELPASRPGEVLPGRNGSTLMVFLTLSMPDEALAGWLEQTARAGGVAVIRGFVGDRLSTTLKRLTALQEIAPATKTHGGVSIDPTAFTRFDVDVAPTVIVSAAPLPPCVTQGCAGDSPPPHDRIKGNITLDHALRLLVRGGDAAPETARRHLAMLETGERR